MQHLINEYENLAVITPDTPEEIDRDIRELAEDMVWACKEDADILWEETRYGVLEEDKEWYENHSRELNEEYVSWQKWAGWGGEWRY